MAKLPSERTLRSQRRQDATDTKPFVNAVTEEHAAAAATAIRTIPPQSKLPAISAADLALLRQKQAKLRRTCARAEPLTPPIQNALRATWIFAQYEAGTAVCIDPAGWILTCAHCYGDDEAEVRANMPGRRWLLAYDGSAVLTECRVWDIRRDLALLRVIAKESDAPAAPFPFVSLSTNPRMVRVHVMCIGQPGADDLESSTARKTLYDLFEISAGTLRGLIPAVDPQDNADLGTLKHDAWTYWGHSGAPILREDNGTMVGLHSSWDDQTTMRHAVPLVAIEGFLKERLEAAKVATNIGV